MESEIIAYPRLQVDPSGVLGAYARKHCHKKTQIVKNWDVTKRACKGFHIILNDTNIAAPAQTGVSDTGMVLACARLALNDAESWSTMSVVRKGFL